VDTREFGGKASAKGVHMPRSTGSRYTQEFKAEAVQLARSYPERSIRQLAYELGISDQTLRNWIAQAQIEFVASARAFPPKSERNCAGCAKRTGS
jgi:transposase-like protein